HLSGLPGQFELPHDLHETAAVLAVRVGAFAAGCIHRPLGPYLFDEEDIVAEAAEAEDVLEAVPRAAGGDGWQRDDCANDDLHAPPPPTTRMNCCASATHCANVVSGRFQAGLWAIR